MLDVVSWVLSAVDVVRRLDLSWSVALIALSIPLTWSWYLSVMHLKSARNRGMLTWPAKALGYPWLVVGVVIDVLFNLIVGSLIFVEVPRELLFTSRVSRLNDRDDWRGRLARWFCRELLDPFDPAGRHCK